MPEVRSLIPFFSNQIAATLRTHSRGVSRVRGNVKTVARLKGLGLALSGDDHFAFEDNVSSFAGMGVLGVKPAGAVLPNVGDGKTFVPKLFSYSFIFITQSLLTYWDAS